MTAKRIFEFSKTGSVLLAFILLLSFLNTSFTFAIQEQTNNLNQLKNQSEEEFTSYQGLNCTKLGEYDSIYGQPVDFSIATIAAREYAFIAEGKGLLVLDVTEPENPVFVNFYFEHRYIESVFVCEDYIYLSGPGNELMIYDVSDVTNPIRLSVSNFMEFDVLANIYVQDDYLYASDPFNGIVILDVSNPTAPQLVGRFHEGSHMSPYFKFQIINDRLYTSKYDTLKIADISNKSNPTLITSYFNDQIGYIEDLIVHNDTIYTCTQDGRFSIIDINNVSSPVLLGFSWDENLQFNDIYVESDICYLLDSRNGLRVLNITNSFEITLLYSTIQFGYYPFFAFNQEIVYLLNNRLGLEIYALTNKITPSLIGRFIDSGKGRSVAVSGETAVVANDYRGLEIYKLKKSVEPELKAQIVGGNAFSYVSINNDIAYAVSLFNLELLTIDISRPSNPKIISNYNLSLNYSNQLYYPGLIRIYGDTAFVIYNHLATSQLKILDLSYSPSYWERASYTLPKYVHTLTYDGYYLSLASFYGDCYVMYYDDGDYDFIYTIYNSFIIHELFIYNEYLFTAQTYNLTVYNISSPTTPVFVLNYHGLSEPWAGYSEVYVDSDIAYLVSEERNELQFVNFEDIEKPYLEGIFRCNESILDFTIDDDYVYLSCDVVNLEVVQMDRLIVPLPKIVLPIVATVVIIGVPIIMVVYYSRRKPEREIEPVVEEPSAPKFPDPEEIDIDVKREDFEDHDLYEYAQEIFDDE